MQDSVEFAGDGVRVTLSGSAPRSPIVAPSERRSDLWRRLRVWGVVLPLATAAFVCAFATGGGAARSVAEGSTAVAETADVALVLAADVSASINSEELRLQRQGARRVDRGARVGDLLAEVGRLGALRADQQEVAGRREEDEADRDQRDHDGLRELALHEPAPGVRTGSAFSPESGSGSG